MSRKHGWMLLLALAVADRGAAQAVSAPGRLEASAPAQQLGFSESGRIEAVLVEAGAAVEKGHLLARLDCAWLEGEAEAARADLAAGRRGARRERIDQAEANLRAAAARLRIAEIELRRLESLVALEAARPSELDRVRSAADEATASHDAASSALLEARAGLPPEEISALEARVRSLEARIRGCRITAPADGVVGRRLMEPGEVVSSLQPLPVVTFARHSAWRVRAEVDEEDVGRVRVGQRARVGAPAFGGELVSGVVISFGGEMGRRSIRSGDPAEKNDRDVGEALIQLERRPPTAMPGLRVRVTFDDATEVASSGSRAR